MKIHHASSIRSRAAAFALAAIMLFGALLIPATPVSAATGCDVQVSGNLLRSKISELLDLINAARKKAGVSALKLDAKAMKIAELRAAQASMVFDHTTPAGRDPKSWSSIDGEPIYDGSWVNENLHFEAAYSNVDIAAHTFDGWFHSASHKASLLRSGVSRVGLAIYQGVGESGLRSYTVVFVSMRELTDKYYGGANKSVNKPRENLIPYTDGFTDTVKTFRFSAKAGNVKLMPGPGTAKINVGDTVIKRPCYYQLSGSQKISSGYCLDSECGVWKSSDASIASVAADGTVTGMAPGQATITFCVNGSSSKAFSYKVQVTADIPAPGQMRMEKRDGRIILSWDAVNLADSYEIYKCSDEFGSYEKIGETTGTTFEVAADDETAYYKLAACKVLLGTTYRSPFGLAAEAAVSQLPAPADLRVTGKTSSKITAAWGEVPGADSYEVQFSTAPDFAARTSYTTTAAKQTAVVPYSGTTYYVRVRACGSDGDKQTHSAWSEPVRATTSTVKATIKSLTSPKTKKLKVVCKGIPGAYGYQIWISTKSSFKSPTKYISKALSTTMAVKKKKTTYYVKVRAVYKNDGVTTYGAFSKTKKIKDK